jgi:hypothetical protein
MRILLPSLVAAAVAFGVAAPASAQHHGAAVARPTHRYDSASTLGLRVASADAQIDMLRDRGVIGPAEAQELHAQSRRLRQRLYGLGAREVADVDAGIARLESQLRLARDDARLGGELFDRHDFEREDADRYESERDSDYADPYLRDPRGDPFAPWEERDRNEYGGR